MRAVRYLVLTTLWLTPLDSAQTAELLVWHGLKPTGKTWVRGPGKTALEVSENAGHGGNPKGLRLLLDGEGWRAAGLNWKGWYPENAADDASTFASLILHIRQISQVKNADLSLRLVDNLKRPAAEGLTVALVADGHIAQIDREWKRVVIPLDKFVRGTDLRLDRLWGIDFISTHPGLLEFHIDRIGFSTERTPPPRFPPEPDYQANVRLGPSRPTHKISDDIYGVAEWSVEKLKYYSVAITRWGGNRSSRYNFKLNCDNAGSDWFFKNGGQANNENGYLALWKRNRSIGAKAYVTLPMLGWVAKDGTSYGFSVKKYGPQKSVEAGTDDVGDGRQPDGKPLVGNDPRDTSIPAPPAFVAEAVKATVAQAGPAKSGGVKYWVLDNEPMLWHSTHRDVFPQPLSIDEFWRRTVLYGEAIKSADPSALVAGYCSWGWLDLYYSALDAQDEYKTKADWKSHGEVPLAEWYLQQCAAYKRRKGESLVDVFDLHWYPQGSVKGRSVYTGRGNDPDLCALRLRSTRELYDVDYVSESWIRDTTPGPVALLPRVRKWIDTHNPGMALCVGEYNFGGDDNISGALAQADVLGIFGRERVDLAFLWSRPEGTLELAWKLFRNYDGRGGRFGDESMACASDSPELTAYAARRSTDDALTVLLLNKRLGGSCEVSLSLAESRQRITAWHFHAADPSEVRPVDRQPQIQRDQLKLRLLPGSATLVVLTK